VTPIGAATSGADRSPGPPGRLPVPPNALGRTAPRRGARRTGRGRCGDVRSSADGVNASPAWRRDGPSPQ